MGNLEYAGENGAGWTSALVVVDTVRHVADVSAIGAKYDLGLKDTRARDVSVLVHACVGLLMLVPVAIGAVAMSNIAFTFRVLIEERRREIGLYRALGATPAISDSGSRRNHVGRHAWRHGWYRARVACSDRGQFRRQRRTCPISHISPRRFSDLSLQCWLSPFLLHVCFLWWQPRRRCGGRRVLIHRVCLPSREMITNRLAVAHMWTHSE